MGVDCMSGTPNTLSKLPKTSQNLSKIPTSAAPMGVDCMSGTPVFVSLRRGKPNTFSKTPKNSQKFPISAAP